MSVDKYLDGLTRLVDTLDKYNDSDTDDVVNQLIASKIQYEQAVKMDMHTREMNNRESASNQASAALGLLDTLPLASSYSGRDRLTDTEGKGSGGARKIIGKGGLIESDKLEFSVSRGGGLMLDGARRRKEANAYLDMHDTQNAAVIDAMNKVKDAKWALGDDHRLVKEGKAKILQEYNHLVDSRNNLVKIDTYALAENYNPIGNKVFRGKEETILERYDKHIAKYESVLDMLEVEE